MRKLMIVSLLVLGACAGPNENDYCAGFGLRPGDAEFARCTQFYFQQEAAFGNDRMMCDLEADKIYPPSLYSRPTHHFIHGGYGPYGYYGGQTVHVGADYQLNAQIDQLRMRIIQPCMQQRGWVSGATWQAGRMGKTKLQPNPSPTNLPWIKK